jgi:hypothetical protein
VKIKFTELIIIWVKRQFKTLWRCVLQMSFLKVNGITTLLIMCKSPLQETVGVGQRGSYYDESGALRDMVQNHILQLVCLVGDGAAFAL